MKKSYADRSTLIRTTKVLSGVLLACIIVLTGLIVFAPSPEPRAYATNSLEIMQESIALNVSDTVLTEQDLAAIEQEKARIAAEEEARRIAAEKAAAEQAAAEQAELDAEIQYSDDSGYEYVDYNDYYYDDDYYYADDGGWYNIDGLTPESGVNYYNGRTETYYSSNVLYHYMTPEWTVGDDGVYRDADGYVVVAANESDYAYGDVIDTSFGEAKVYDTGCDSGVTDVYVNW